MFSGSLHRPSTFKKGAKEEGNPDKGKPGEIRGHKATGLRRIGLSLWQPVAEGSMSKHQNRKKTLLASFAVVIAFSLFAPLGWAEAPKISSINFPSYLPPNASSLGQIVYEDMDNDLSYARFDVADGRYFQEVVSSEAMTGGSGALTFSLKCSTFGQQVTLGVTLFDAAGERSEQQMLEFTCGRPTRYNFAAEMAESLPINQSIPLNIFIIDDGVTALADDAQFSSTNILGIPRTDISAGIKAKVVNSLGSVWDQCGIGFELINAWVVDPARVAVSGGSLNDLFVDHEGHQVIRHGQLAGDSLRLATFRMWNEAQRLDPRAAHGFNVLIMGSGIIAEYQGQLAEVEGFSNSIWPNYAIVRQGTLLDNVLPSQMIATLAHELGHNLGLGHPGEDGLFDVMGDQMNLMKGSGVAPQPRANLLQSQCDRAHATYEALLARMPEIESPEEESASAHGAEIQWHGEICPELRCAGEVKLELNTEGLEGLDMFSFASFEYSADGEHFIEIAIDKRYQDGFSALWDTRDLPNGTYTLRAVVTNSQGAKAEVTIAVQVEN